MKIVKQDKSATVIKNPPWDGYKCICPKCGTTLEFEKFDELGYVSNYRDFYTAQCIFCRTFFNIDGNLIKRYAGYNV